MKAKKPMTHEIREQIQLRKKKNLDISDLIKDRVIRGEDLSYCKIDKLYCVKEDISNTNFANSTIGAQFQKVKATKCNFRNTVFLTNSSLRGGDFRDSNFYKSVGLFVDASYADFRGCNICDATFTWGAHYINQMRIDKKTAHTLLHTFKITE